MAVKWAVANGNWSAGSTWNDGVVPTSNDDVYANGHTIAQLPNGVFVKSLRNDANDDYSIVRGGYFEQASALNNTITANIIADNNYCIFTHLQGSGTALCTLTINGNIINSSGIAIHMTNSSSTHHIVINGNVTLSNGSAIFDMDSGNLRFTIVGSIISDGISYIYAGPRQMALQTFTFAGNITNVIYMNGQTITTCNGSGNWQVPTSQTVTTATITGDVILNSSTTFTTANITGKIVANGYVLAGTTLNIDGSITYESTNNRMGVRYTTMNILNPDTFTWKDVTEPRSNPFIIITDAEMNNRQQYPPEDEVKEGTEYVWGEKVGAYQQPPESVVLKDYEYDTITAEENDIATYNLTRYIYADYGTLHWFELKTTTTDIVTDPTLQSIDIDGDTVAADTDYVVEYNGACYQWDGSAWGSITTNNIGTVKTDIVTNPTETTLCAKKGTLDVPSTQAIVTAINQSTIATNVSTLLQRLSDGLTQRLGQSVTIPILQQILDAHLN